MAAQANRIGVVADNMANVNTTGFTSVPQRSFPPSFWIRRAGSYNSGGVETRYRGSM